MAKIDINTFFSEEELQKLLAGEEIAENTDLVLYGTHFQRRSKGRENTRRYHATHKAQERQYQLEYLARPEVKKRLAEIARKRRAGNTPYAIWAREYAKRKYWEMKADPVAYARHLEQMKVWAATYRDKHRTELREMWKRRYRERTPEQIAHDKEIDRIWEEKNRQKRSAQAKARYHANPEKCRQQAKAYRKRVQNNPQQHEKNKQYQRDYYAKHIDELRERNRLKMQRLRAKWKAEKQAQQDTPPQD